MNPLRWKRERQAALTLLFLVGAIFGVVVGYLVYATGAGSDGAASFGTWLSFSFQMTRDWSFSAPGIWWALTGGAVAMTLAYVRLLLQR